MTRLILRVLGLFQADLDGTHLPRFESEKVRALLAYLMVESAQVHRREKLAGLLWADMPETRARSNLSQALYNLSNLLKDSQNTSPFLIRSSETVQFNPYSQHWLDGALFASLLEAYAQHRHTPPEIC